MTALPLAGVRVLECASVIAGPYCSYLLTLLGAGTIKLERPSQGDWMRSQGGDATLAAAGLGSMFLSCSAGKRSVALNLKDPRGVKIVREIASRADVMIENWRPGTAARLGVGFDEIKSTRWPLPVFPPVRSGRCTRSWTRHRSRRVHCSGALPCRNCAAMRRSRPRASNSMEPASPRSMPRPSWAPTTRLCWPNSATTSCSVVHSARPASGDRRNEKKCGRRARSVMPGREANETMDCGRPAGPGSGTSRQKKWRSAPASLVMAGLDPAIYPGTSVRRWPGQAL